MNSEGGGDKASGGTEGGESGGGQDGGQRERVAPGPEATGKGRVSVVDDSSSDDGSDDDNSDESLAEQDARKLLERAVAIRAARLGKSHFEYALCLLKLAEYYWLAEDYARVLDLYMEAIGVLTEHPIYTEKSKTVVQLFGWLTHVFILLNDLPEALKANEKALNLVKHAFGEVSWELHRVMLDKARAASSTMEHG
jgi:tetratricopeptide (TPR) repeat protein